MAKQTKRKRGGQPLDPNDVTVRLDMRLPSRSKRRWQMAAKHSPSLSAWLLALVDGHLDHIGFPWPEED